MSGNKTKKLYRYEGLKEDRRVIKDTIKNGRVIKSRINVTNALSWLSFILFNISESATTLTLSLPHHPTTTLIFFVCKIRATIGNQSKVTLLH